MYNRRRKFFTKKRATRIKTNLKWIAFWGLILLIILLFFFRDMRYFIFQKPLYALFGNCFYFPFFLYFIPIVLISSLLLLGLYLEIKKKNKDKYWPWTMPLLALAAFVCWFVFREPVKDISAIWNDTYLTGKTQIGSLKARWTHYGKGGQREYTLSVETDYNDSFKIKMDYYQYSQIKKMQEQHSDKMLIVKYLPNTKRLLSWRLSDENNTSD